MPDNPHPSAVVIQAWPAMLTEGQLVSYTNLPKERLKEAENRKDIMAVPAGKRGAKLYLKSSVDAYIERVFGTNNIDNAFSNMG